MAKVVINVHRLDNGLTLVAERMPEVRSAAFMFLLPAGAAYDPPQQSGLAAMLCELVFRGAGPRDSRQLSDYLDSLGLQRSQAVSAEHIALGGSLLSENLNDALQAYADVLQRPHLRQQDFAAGQQLALQALASLQDEPRRRTMYELARRFFPYPLGRCPLGEVEHIRQMSWQQLREGYERAFGPDGAILAVAGRFDWDALRDHVEKLFGRWHGSGPTLPQVESVGTSSGFIKQQTEQIHIGVAYPAVRLSHPDYYKALASVAVLSGGMSGRLFTEVREKRNLCYAVYAYYHALRDAAGVFCYAGTTTARAQQTLEVLLAELRRLGEGVSDEELQRAKVGLKSSLVMQGESTAARASAAASDYYHLGRVRTLEEIKRAIEELTIEQLCRYVSGSPPRDFTIVSIGPEPLDVA